MLLEPGFWGALLGGALRLATPLALAAFGELLVQRAGLVNLGIEGMMVCGCLAGVVGAAAGGWEAGLALGAASGAVLGALLAATVLLGKAEVVVAGIGTGVLATGAADYGFDLWLRHGSAAVPVFAPVLPLPWSDRWPPTLAAILTQSLVSWATLVIGLLLGAWLRYGRAGPVLEAVGSAPEIARLRGVAVARWQAASLVLGGTLAGIAGAALTVAYVGSFTSGMSGGRGFIAIAMVLLARGRAARLGLAALGFALLESAGLQLQGRSSIVLVALGTMLPYLATLATLGMTGVARRRPSAAGGVSVMGA